MLDRTLERVADMPEPVRDDKAATQQLLLQLSRSLLAESVDGRPVRQAALVLAAASQLLGAYALWFAKTADAPVEAALRYLLRAMSISKVGLPKSKRTGQGPDYQMAASLSSSCLSIGNTHPHMLGCRCSRLHMEHIVRQLHHWSGSLVFVAYDKWPNVYRRRRITRHTRSAACASGAPPNCGGQRRSSRSSKPPKQCSRPQPSPARAPSLWRQQQPPWPVRIGCSS